MATSSLQHFDAFKKLLQAKSVAADSSYAQGIVDAQNVLIEALKGMGLKTETIELPKNAMLLAKHQGQPGTPHVVIYGHYDVQPVDPIELWESDPFAPRIHDGKIYARGAADNKGPLMAVLGGLTKFLQSDHRNALSITVMIEGEEEIGSPSFDYFLKNHKEKVMGDFLLIVDSMNPSMDCPAISIGCRGVASLEVKLTGPAYDLHSGQHGGAVRNPIQALVQLLSTLHTPEGKINIPGYYDDVLPATPWQREQLKAWPQTITEYQQSIGVPELHVIPGHTAFEAISFLPTLEFNGITGGYQAEGSKTVIPSTASAKISLRLVPNQTAEKAFALVTQALKERLPSGVTMDITYGSHGNAYRVTPPQDPSCDLKSQKPILTKAFHSAQKVCEKFYKEPPIYMCGGGTLPLLSALKEATHMDAILLGLFTPESRIHSPNENVPLALLEKGEKLIAEFLEALAEEEEPAKP
jgi:acetylornithine deacetylase/succinyl-diaminopimelate desuccinylase-like protein